MSGQSLQAAEEAFKLSLILGRVVKLLSSLAYQLTQDLRQGGSRWALSNSRTACKPALRLRLLNFVYH